MATEPLPETANARYEAIVALHRAISELECGDSHSARNFCLAALAWIRDV